VTAARREVIFVGGTRFSGADAVAALLARQPDTTALPPVGFHSDPWGIPALLHGRMGIEDFAERMREQEIAEQVPGDVLDAALGALRAGYHEDPLGSCRRLFWALVDELAPAESGATLVEASPGNLFEAQTLIRLVPQARFVHVVRDGLEVAAEAVASDAVAVHRIPAALEWWADGLREIERGVRGEEDGAPYAIPEDRLSIELADSDRGRWRERTRGPGRWWARRRYERTIGELEAESNHAAPVLRAAYDRLG
jgi:sulfotransferase family protein